VRRQVYTHGYSGYTNGCRCDTCRAAKATYMRTRRAQARALAAATARLTGRPRHAPGVTHATSYAYFEKGCRCPACNRWKYDGDMARVRDRRDDPYLEQA
jgi:hypothetical protein